MEGEFISQILHLGDIPSKYYYIRTKKELIKVLEIFEESEFRYLHISCHGSSSSIETTIDSIPFHEIGEIMRPYLSHKRLFISACSTVNKKLATELFKNKRFYSIIGPKKDIYISDAAIFWASFYHLILEDEKMNYENLSKKLRQLAKLYNIPMNYFHKNRNVDKGFKLSKF